MDEVTAYRARREGVFCPRRDGAGSPCGHLLDWRSEGGEAHLCCFEHGEVFVVERAA